MSRASPSNRAIKAAPGRDKYLSFPVGAESFALRLLNVQEIITPIPITRVPGGPAYLLGVGNLRGRVLPIIDLRMRFGIDTSGARTGECVVVMQSHFAGDVVTVGAKVDDVPQVRFFEKGQIERPQTMGLSIDPELISGMVQTSAGVVIIVNLQKILTPVVQCKGLPGDTGVAN